MNIFEHAALLLFLAFAVERLVEVVLGKPFDKIPRLTPHKWMLMYVGIVVGLVASFVYQIDLFTAFGMEQTVFGIVLSGLVIGGGSNVANDIIKRIGAKDA